jgi:hypothetical protein
MTQKNLTIPQYLPRKGGKLKKIAYFMNNPKACVLAPFMVVFQRIEFKELEGKS